MVTRFTAVVTADRYGAKGANLDHERELLAGFPDIDVDLRGEPIHSEDELIALGNEADALFLSTRDAVTRRFCEQAEKVKVVARYGVGLDNVDLAAAADHGIVITHYPQYCTNEVADHALALLLTLNRRIAELSTDLHADAWNTHGRMTREILRGPIEPLYKQTIGVIALGRIGSAVVSRIKPFRSRIIVCDPYVDDDEIRALGAEPVSLDELVSTADMITIHCPLTPETRGLLGPAQFAAMKPHVSIVNTARGPIINQAALIDFLTSHPDARAGLDVFEEEPLEGGSPLYQIPNVLLTPHSAYYSEESTRIVRDQTFLSAIAVLRGYLPPTVANPGVLDKVNLAPAPA
jgi:D-3-phosphoglycerate dehydrogenase